VVKVLDDLVAEAVEVTKRYGATLALDGVTMTIARGQIEALVGHNGAGKSTLVGVLAGAVAADEGAVRIGGATLRARPAEALRLGVRCIYQHRTLMPNLSVAENVTVLERPGLRRQRRAERDVARRRLQLLDSDLDPRRLVRGLNPGEAQEVEIARGLDGDARLLILDEPTASLSGREADRLRQVLLQLRAAGIGLLLVSHDLDYVLSVADRVTILRDGRAVMSCTAAGLTRDRLVAEMLGDVEEPVECERGHCPIGAPVISAKAVSTGRRLDRVDVDACAGEVLGITGVVGSGIDELARILAGAVRPESGVLAIRGRPTELRSPRQALKRGIAYLPDDRASAGLFPNLTATQQVGLTRLAISRTSVLRRGRDRREARKLLMPMGFQSRWLSSRPSRLSGGNQQKILVARSLMAAPSALIAHEPTTGVDVGARAEIHAQLRALAATGVAVIVVSSDAEEVAVVADRAIVLRNGMVVAAIDRPSEQELIAATTGES
jgi:ABC-type sugar transport system ATPase subunit